MRPGSACPLPTTTERRQRDLLVRTLTRLHGMQKLDLSMTEMRREIALLADLIRAELDREVAK